MGCGYVLVVLVGDLIFKYVKLVLLCVLIVECVDLYLFVLLYDFVGDLFEIIVLMWFILFGKVVVEWLLFSLLEVVEGF